MEVISTPDVPKSNARIIVNAGPDTHEQAQRQRIVGVVLLVIVLFQLVNLPGAIFSQSAMAVGTVLLGLALCAAAAVFNRYGKATIVSILLIAVVDLGCGLMLLTSPMGLDVADLPVFDVLLVSELIAVSLLSAISVFYVVARYSTLSIERSAPLTGGWPNWRPSAPNSRTCEQPGLTRTSECAGPQPPHVSAPSLSSRPKWKTTHTLRASSSRRCTANRSAQPRAVCGSRRSKETGASSRDQDRPGLRGAPLPRAQVRTTVIRSPSSKHSLSTP